MVPVFNDKHLAYDFVDAQWVWNRAGALEIPLMAGSCLPLAWRQPWLEHEKGAPIEEADGPGASRPHGASLDRKAPDLLLPWWE